MYSKKPDVSEEELALMETQDLIEKCGKCDGQLILKVYYSQNDYYKKIECTKCGLGVWLKKD